jgi:uncharacterized membrane protein YoaT (DUF817 family)
MDAKPPPAAAAARPPRPSRLLHALRQLLRFGWIQARACTFAVALVGGIAASSLVPEAVWASFPRWLPLGRYDVLLGYGLLISVLARRLGRESSRDLTVIACCHLAGLVFELAKVRLGSWSYPEEALTKFGGVPLYSGFLYAAVGSYVCRAWHLFGLGLYRYRARAMAALALAVYANFLTHHWLPDARWLLAGLLLCATAGTRVGYTVGPQRYRMPLALAFALIGFFLWVAENAATYAGAWSYPHQLDGWEPVSLSKFAAWSLLITVLFVPAAGRFPETLAARLAAALPRRPALTSRARRGRA